MGRAEEIKMERKITEVDIFYEGLDHPECVAVHPDGSVWAGGEAGQIYRISPDGKKIQEMTNTGGFILGIAFSPGAEWLAICDNKRNCVWKYELKSGRLSLLASSVEGEEIMIPNYAVFDRKGNLYVSDSGAFRKKIGKIYKFDPLGKGVIWHRGPFNFTNGMALSNDHGQLYVVCTWLPGVEAISINKDGSAGERNVLVTIPKTCPDGIALDEAGNIFISCYAPNVIYRLTPEGNLSEYISDWEAHTLSNPTNIAFGGSDRKTLYIANLGRWHISSLQMDISGVSLHY